MKLEYWDNKFFTLELNSTHMSEAHKWPLLDSVLAATDNAIPLTSASKTGRSIYVGWASLGPSGNPDVWFYHHALCVPSMAERNKRSFGFSIMQRKDAWHRIVSSKKALIAPVFNIGALPESKTFVKILNDHGILAHAEMPALSTVELIKK
jgi:hypothetical protein